MPAAKFANAVNESLRRVSGRLLIEGQRDAEADLIGTLIVCE